MDERCTSTIESSDDRVKSSSSPSYGDELELIYVHKTTNTDDATKKQVKRQPIGKEEKKGKKDVPIVLIVLLTCSLPRM